MGLPWLAQSFFFESETVLATQGPFGNRVSRPKLWSFFIGK
jgi:hypothetical protein